MSDNYLFVTPGDITHLSADAVAYSTDRSFFPGFMYRAFCEQIPGFKQSFEAMCEANRWQCEPGKAYWVPLPNAGRLQGVAVVAGVHEDEAFTNERLAVEQAIACAVANLKQNNRDRLLIALPAFGMGAGAAPPAEHAASARLQVRTAWEALIDHENVNIDAAFVTYTPANYALFLQARRAECPPLRPPVDVPDALERGLKSGDCVIFVGAGVSHEADLLDWAGLVSVLAAELGLTPEERASRSPLDIAEWYRLRHGPTKLSDVIRTHFGPGAGKPTLAHYLLTALPLRFFITTNYDQLLESALDAMKCHHVRIVEDRQVSATGWPEGVFVVKLHGDAEHPERIVLSRRDYDGYFNDRPAMAALLRGLLLNHTFFFVGYSLSDPNFRQIHHEIARILPDSQRTAFITYFDEGRVSDGMIAEQLRRQRIEAMPLCRDAAVSQPQQFLRLLDQLADHVTTTRSTHLFLRDLEVSEQVLVESVLAVYGASKDTRQKVALLEFLTQHGWRPDIWDDSLCEQWLELAEKTYDLMERRRLLVFALRHAPSLDAARRVRGKLRETEERLAGSS